MERVLKGHFEIESGLVTNSNLLCWLFTAKDQREKVGFSISTPSTFASVSFGNVLRPPQLAWDNRQRPGFSVVLETVHMARFQGH